MKSSFFIAHGAPTIFMEDSAYTAKLKSFKQDFPTIKRLLFFSAHNDSPKLKLAAVENYRTIHDFYGFPQALYEINMKTKGDPALATHLSSYLNDHKIEHDLLTEAGIDHGVWTVLKLIDPNDELKVVNLSISSRSAPESLLELGQLLHQYREEDTAIIFSGGLLHNLRAVNFGAFQADAWATRFNQAMDEAILSLDPQKVVAMTKHPDFRMAAPTVEHFIGLYLVYGTISSTGTATKLAHTIDYGNLGLDYWHFQA